MYDSSKNLIDLSTIETKGAKITAIIQCLGLWAIAGKFGCTWKVLQMRVVPVATIKGWAFKDLDDKDDEDDDQDWD